MTSGTLMASDLWDALIVGGGPAGLSAALVLGRCRRSVLLFDDGQPRNLASHAVHGFLSRDGITPAELRAIAREQLARYPSVAVDGARVMDALREHDRFQVFTADGRSFGARKLLLAGGVVDNVPQQPGFRELYGYAVFLCPYCDGWEMQDRRLAVYGRGDDKGGGLALEMTCWSRDIILCTDGPAELGPECRARLERHGITVREEPILRLDGERRAPYRTPFSIVFESGARLERDAVFFNTGRRQANDLALRLGCDTWDTTGCTVDNKEQMSHVPGLYIAGDASRDVLQAIVAAAEGAQAAIGINTALLREDTA